MLPSYRWRTGLSIVIGRPGDGQLDTCHERSGPEGQAERRVLFEGVSAAAGERPTSTAWSARAWPGRSRWSRTGTGRRPWRRPACTRRRRRTPTASRRCTWTSPSPRFATIACTRTGCPAITTPSSASRSSRRACGDHGRLLELVLLRPQGGSRSRSARPRRGPVRRVGLAAATDAGQPRERRAPSRASGPPGVRTLAARCRPACAIVARPAFNARGHARRERTAPGPAMLVSTPSKSAGVRPSGAARQRRCRRAGTAPPAVRAAAAAGPCPGTCACCAPRRPPRRRSRRAAGRRRRCSTGSSVDAGRRRRLATEAVAAGVIQLLRLPGPEACLQDLVGELRGIAGRAEGLARDARLRLVVLAAALAVGPHRDDDVGPDRADDPDVVGEDLLPAPLLEASRPR